MRKAIFATAAFVLFLLSGGTDAIAKPFGAKDVRTLVYEATVAAGQEQSLNLETAAMTLQGISLKGGKCEDTDTWRTFTQGIRTQSSGGELCTGEKSFDSHPWWGSWTFPKLLRDVAKEMFKRTGLPGLNVGQPYLIRSDGEQAIFKFAHPGWAGQFKAIRFDGTKLSYTKYTETDLNMPWVISEAQVKISEATRLSPSKDQFNCRKVSDVRAFCQLKLTEGHWWNVKRCRIALTGTQGTDKMTIRFVRKKCWDLDIEFLSNGAAWKKVREIADPGYFAKDAVISESSWGEAERSVGFWGTAMDFDLRWRTKTEKCRQMVRVDLIDGKVVGKAEPVDCQPRTTNGDG